MATDAQAALPLGTYVNRNMTCDVRPTIHEGFVFVTVFADGSAIGPRRGIASHSAKLAAEYCGFSFVNTSFRAEEHPAAGVNPFLCPLKKVSRASDVYFIRNSRGGPVKIGKAQCVESRLAAIQACSPVELQLVAVIIGGGGRVERELHKRFAEHRLHGEWFSPCDELLALIESHGGQP